MTMRVAVAVFAKTVGLSPVKTRLQKALGQELTEFLYLDFCVCTRAVVERARDLNADVSWRLVWSFPESNAIGHVSFPQWESLWQGGEYDLGGKLSHVYETLIKENDAVILMGTDTPHLQPEIVVAAARALRDHEFVFGPAVDGGFYIFGGRSLVPRSDWLAVTYSSETTRESLRQVLQRRGTFAPDLRYEEDVDTLEELLRVREELGRMQSILPEQKQLYRRLLSQSGFV